jgi:hypothetical protein
MSIYPQAWYCTTCHTRMNSLVCPSCVFKSETAPDPAGLAKQRAREPLRPNKPQAACDVGLFSDDARQIDLEDLLR